MNWSHALLVVAITSSGGGIVAAILSNYDNMHWSYRDVARNWMVFFFIVATVSGALAAGLWR